MSKTTAPGYPDPSEWHRRLAESLERRQAEYNKETSPLLRRRMAGLMLADVVLALKELPRFRNTKPLMGLKDLVTFLADLEAGKRHPWLQPDGIGAGNALTTSEVDLRVWVKAVCTLLIEHGFGKTEAYKYVAKGLKKSSLKAAVGVDHRTIGKWFRAPTAAGAARAEAGVTAKLRRWWSDNRQDDASADDADKTIAAFLSDHVWSETFIRD